MLIDDSVFMPGPSTIYNQLIFITVLWFRHYCHPKHVAETLKLRLINGLSGYGLTALVFQFLEEFSLHRQGLCWLKWVGKLRERGPCLSLESGSWGFKGSGPTLSNGQLMVTFSTSNEDPPQFSQRLDVLMVYHLHSLCLSYKNYLISNCRNKMWWSI